MGPKKSALLVIGKCLILLGLVNALQFGLLVKTGWLKHLVIGSEVYVSLEKSRACAPSAKILILGDSVCHQIYPPETSSANCYSLACNQAVTMAGHYFLLQNFLNTNLQFTNKEVILIYHPRSFKTELPSVFGYNYFLKPFPLKEYRREFTAQLLATVKATPFYFAAQLPMVKTSTWAPRVSLAHAPSNGPVISQDDGWYCSQLSLDYLRNMKILAESRRLKLRILAGFVNEQFRSRHYTTLKRQIREAGLETEFTDYFERITYLPDDMFVDDVHVRNAGILGPNFLKL